MESLEMYRNFLKAHWWDERERSITDMKRELSPPEPQKPYADNVKLIDLVRTERFTIGKMQVLEAIKSRRSLRTFNEEYLTLEELSYLLWSTQGVSEQNRSGSTSRRTVPSAGSRHPFETYLLVTRVMGLEPGLYRYLPLDHRMYFMYADPDMSTKIIDGCRQQAFVGKGAVVFIWTVIPYRSEWRYGVVAPKMVALDAGHLCQNLYIACESIGAGTCAIGAYNQDMMDDIVKVDGKDEFVIYLAPVGKPQ